MRAQIREGERVTVTVRTGSLFALGLWGPRARDVLRAVTDVDVSNEAFPYMTARYLNVGEVGPVWTQRISLCGRAGVGAVRPDRDGRPRVGAAVGGRP